MAKQALILIDYTYDFVADDGKLTCGAAAQAIESAIVQRIQNAMDLGELIFVCNDLHEENDVAHPENKLYPPHNVRNTAGRELYGEVKHAVDAAKRKDGSKVIELDKTRYSAFERTPLQELLQANKVDTVLLAGVCTEICVLHTAVDAYNKDYTIHIAANSVASSSPQGHEFALIHFKNALGASIL